MWAACTFGSWTPLQSKISWNKMWSIAFRLSEQKYRAIYDFAILHELSHEIFFFSSEHKIYLHRLRCALIRRWLKQFSDFWSCWYYLPDSREPGRSCKACKDRKIKSISSLPKRLGLELILHVSVYWGVSTLYFLESWYVFSIAHGKITLYFLIAFLRNAFMDIS